MPEGAIKKLFSGLLRKPQVPDRERTEPGTGVAPAESMQSSIEQVVIRLQQLVEERSFVEVRFPGRSDNTYQSLILKVDPLERYVLIDELFPAHGAFFVSPGDEVEVTSVRRGIPVRFSTWIRAISLDEADGYPAYKLALPDAVEAKQRRTHFRVQIDPDAGLKLRIKGPDGNRLVCTVQDLSFSGLGFTAHGNLTDMLRANSQLRGCTLTIPSLPDVACDLEVRTFEFRRQPYRHTVVGARFDGLGTSAEKQLEHYLVLLQRQQRRDIGRG